MNRRDLLINAYTILKQVKRFLFLIIKAIFRAPEADISPIPPLLQENGSVEEYRVQLEDYNSILLERRTMHEELSKATKRIFHTLIAVCSFFILTLFGTTDLQLLTQDATVKLPIINYDINFDAFLIFGPLFVVCIVLYLHVFVGNLRLHPIEKSNVPTLFNLRGYGEKILTWLLFYGLAPATLLLFFWKASPMPFEGEFCYWAAILTTYVLFFIWFRRCSNRWVMILILLFFSLTIKFPIFVNKEMKRTLYLFRVDLKGKDLRGRHMIGANLVESVLEKANLEKVNFRSANLYKANLIDANLQGAMLSNASLLKAKLMGANLNDTNFSRIYLPDYNKTYKQGIFAPAPKILAYPEANLSEANLTNAKLNNAKLSYVNFTNANLTNAILIEADLYHANLKNAVMNGANMSYVFLEGAELSGASFIKTNLSYALLGGVNMKGLNFSESNFSNATLNNANLSKANLSNANLKGTSLHNTNLKWANLIGVKIDKKTQISNKWRIVWELVNGQKPKQVLKGIDLSEVNFINADLRNLDLTEVKFGKQAQLGETEELSKPIKDEKLRLWDQHGVRIPQDLYSSHLKGVDFRGSKLSKANFRYADLRNTDFSGVDLSKADLRWADLRGANLINTNLTETNLWAAWLTGADLTGADLTGANLSEVNLNDVNLRGATLSNTNLNWSGLKGLIIDDDTKISNKWKMVWQILNNPRQDRRYRGLDLSKANLKGADLKNADLRDTDLRGTILMDSNLKGSDLRNSQLSGVYLMRAELRCEQLESGLKWEKSYYDIQCHKPSEHIDEMNDGQFNTTIEKP